MISLCMSYQPIHHYVTTHWTCTCHIFTQISPPTKFTDKKILSVHSVFFFHSILHIKRTSAQHITRSYIYKIAFYASFPNGNFSGWLLFLSKLWHKVCHERKCTRPAQEWIMGVIIFLWIFSWSCAFSARLMLLRQRGSTTICSWRRRCG